jgi:hypothetical protein
MGSAQIDDAKSILPDCALNPAEREKEPMSALGHKRTFSDALSNVRYWGQSGHPMSAF